MKKIICKIDRAFICVIFCIIVYVAIFFTLSVLRYKAFFSYEWEDLAAANHLCWNLSQGHMSHYFNFYKHDRLQIPPFVILISAFYFCVPYIYTLFFVVTTSLAIAAIAIYVIAENFLKNKQAAVLLAIAYLLYAPKNSLNFLDGDTSIYTIPLLLFTFYATLVGKKNQFNVCSILVMLCKTETPSYMTLLATYLFIKRRDFNKIDSRVYLFMGLLSIFFLVGYVILSNKFGKEPICESCTVISDIASSLTSLNPLPLSSYFSHIKIECFFKLFLPVLLFPLFTPEILLGLPSIFLIVNTEDFLFQRAHYISNLVPFIFIGTIFFIKKISAAYPTEEGCHDRKLINIFKKHCPTILSLLVFLGCFLSNFAPNIIGGPHRADVYRIADDRFINITNIYDPRFYQMDKADRIAWRMVNMIPKDPLISVAATGDLLPPLSSRKKIIEFLDNQYDYYAVDYILIHNKNMYMGAGQYFWNDEKIKEELTELLNNNAWETLAIEDDFYLFKRK